MSFFGDLSKVIIEWIGSEYKNRQLGASNMHVIHLELTHAVWLINEWHTQSIYKPQYMQPSLGNTYTKGYSLYIQVLE